MHVKVCSSVWRTEKITHRVSRSVQPPVTLGLEMTQLTDGA